MSKRAERPGDGWGRDPASLDLTPESYPDWTANGAVASTDGAVTEAEPDEDGGTPDRPTSSTADTLVRRAMRADEANPAPEEYETFGVVGYRPEE
ncbi:hypothetical protein [Candidatus Halobonum tyrrellensis]|uniref:Uncharacterized protein n=1 Tax=Candidatus Halobonum tyrrellensis G22 TaxID=1324957 RepID=V4GU75_9EURY|nr:hypothetical protein [Candidatus Halobonum tyrrellensis]ESP88681.1 hypothetical protein K933_07518 [Candidatus Halobonum tyrrellensis G22]